MRETFLKRWEDFSTHTTWLVYRWLCADEIRKSFYTAYAKNLLPGHSFDLVEHVESMLPYDHLWLDHTHPAGELCIALVLSAMDTVDHAQLYTAICEGWELEVDEDEITHF